MNGVAAVLQVLAEHDGVTAIVPANGASPPRLVAGTVSQGAALPWLAVRQVSTVDAPIVEEGAQRHVTDRVQISIAAATYPALKALEKAVKTACAGVRPEVAGINAVSMHVAAGGADGFDPAGQFPMSTRDVLVKYLEATAS